MYLVTSNKTRQLLCMNYVGQVLPEELKLARADVQAQLAELKPGFRLLADLSQVEAMAPECAPEIGRIMELLDHVGVGLIVRVIPDPSRDIGMNILTIFHYPHHPRIITCENLAQAFGKLSL